SVDVSTYYDDWANTNGLSTNPVPWTIDNTAGTVKAGGEAIIGGSPGDGPTGTGPIATITLHAVANASGTSTITLTNADISPNVGGQGADVTPTLTNCEVTIGEVTGSPTVTVGPGTPTVTVGPGTPTHTPGPGTPTVTVGPGTPTHTPGPGTPTVT